ncbi:6-phosphofructokinase 1 [bacterium BMS3Abin05]|nr:6-phosphofructokinase 1 [bacterium BMS3Abin05]
MGAEISRRLNVETRVTVLGHLQRGGGPIPFDRFLATRFGKAAVQLIAENKMGQMVCLHGRKVESISIEKAAGANKLVDPDGQVVKMAESLGICLGR